MSQPKQATSQGLSAAATTAVMLAVALVLFAVFALILFFYLRAKRYPGANPAIRSSEDHQGPAPPRGLDLALVQSLPVTVFRSEGSKEALECAVCLSELSEGEETRVLPKCSHGFHLECIDLWFLSNSTCPLCRRPVCSEQLRCAESGTNLVEVSPIEEVFKDGNSTEPPNLPANAKLRVNRECLAAAAITNQGSSSSAGLVIETPRQAVDGLRSPPRIPDQDLSPPKMVRLRSLRTLLSLGSRGNGFPCRPVLGDIEQGAT